MRFLVLVVFLLCFTGGSAMSQEEVISSSSDVKNVSITVYNQNFAVVRERREIPLKIGVNRVRYEGVAQRIDPTSIAMKSLTSPNGVRVLEQNYQYDLISPNTILEKSVGSAIRLIQQRSGGITEVLEGVLLSTPSQGNVVQLADGRVLLNPSGTIEVASLPEGLLSRPSLLWHLSSDRAGTHTTEASYLTDGLSWKADYVAVVTEDEKKVDVTGWVTIDNQSGATYANANLQLMAGDVRRVQENMPFNAPIMMRAEAAMADQGGFEEESFFEYHLYTLDGETTVREKEVKQLNLMSAADVPVARDLVFNTRKGDKFRVVLKLKNSEANNLGMPLPKGKVRVYKADRRGNLQFLGEDLIDHTPRNEEIELYIGDAFDVVGERTRKSYDRSSRWITETVQFSVRNRKESAVNVTVEENLWGDWEITERSHAYKDVNANMIAFPLTVPADSELIVSYTVRWRVFD